MRHRNRNRTEYEQLKSKILLRFFCLGIIAQIVVYSFYMIVWQGRGGDWVVHLFRGMFHMNTDGAVSLYHRTLRTYIDIIWLAAFSLIFFILFKIIVQWFIQYFDDVNKGIDALLSEDETIRLPSEMLAIERKLNAVKQILKQRELEVQSAEQRKNDLVMYLAHDIRTPLTSIIGYLNLLSEAPEMPAEQREKYTGITLDKAYRLEKMMNEFFEITRYNLQQISLTKETIDLYYMLVQLCDELSPVFSEKGNRAILQADESLSVYGDPDKLARVFGNVFKNAAAYSVPDTEIVITAEEENDNVVIKIHNCGKTIPKEKLEALFDKFYRLDDARTSNTGGAGLGLAIAREIVTAHGGTIQAKSWKNTVTFTVILPSGRP